MSPFPRVFVPVFLIAAVAPVRRDELAFGVAPQTTLVRTLASTLSIELTSMALTLDGESIPAEALGEFDMRVERKEECVVTDVFEDVGGGRPLRWLRSFDALGGDERTHVTSEEGEDQATREFESVLEGQRVRFSWNEAAGAFEAAFPEGVEGDPALLAELDADMDFLRFLPAGAVAEGESWPIEPAAFRCILDPGGDLRLEVESEGELDTSEQDAELRANLAGKITATHRGTRTQDGRRLAVIELALDTDTHAEDTGPMPDEPSSTATNRVEAVFRLTGELLWDLDQGHASALELSGTNEFRMVQTLVGQLDGEAFEQVQTMVFTGTSVYSMRFEQR